MIDLHAHILPGLDDGSPDMDTSLRMLTIAEEEGVTDIAATTHFIPGTWTQPADAVRKALDEFRARIDKESFSIRVTAVHEIHAGAGIVERLKKDEVLPYDTKCRYILLEMPHALVPAWMNQLVTELIQADITPIIAHPERNRDIKRAPKIVYDLVERGCLMQITAASVLGKTGSTAKKIVETLLKHQLVHAIGSDAHDDEKRPPKLAEAWDQILEWTDENTVKSIFETNPRGILNSQDLGIPRPLPFSADDESYTLGHKIRRLFT